MKTPIFGINLSEWAIRHQALVQFFMVVVLILGVIAYGKLGQKEDPEFTFKAMMIRTMWPGSTAEEMGALVADKIEKRLQDIAAIDYLKTFVKPGEAQILIMLHESTPNREVAGVWDRVRKKILDMKNEQVFPPNLLGPFVNDEFGDTFGNIYAISGRDFSLEELRKYAEYARQRLLMVNDVAKIELLGEQQERVEIQVDSAKISALGFDLTQVWQAIEAQNQLLSAGEFQTSSSRIALRVSGAFHSVEDIAAMPLHIAGKSLQLRDLATVKRQFVSPKSMTMRHQGENAIGIALSMRKGGDVIKLGENLQNAVREIEAELPLGVSILPVSDQPKVVRASIREFMQSLLEAVLIVLAVSLLSLGFKTGVVVALSIPLVLAMTFVAMWIFGIDLQRISLGSLIIALGLLVDDAIIAVEMMALKLEQGWDKLRAATFAYLSTAFPMLTGTLVTAATFLPVGLAKSNAGEYTFSLFAVVGIALVLSWVVAVVFTPLIGFKLLKTKASSGGQKSKFFRIGGQIIAKQASFGGQTPEPQAHDPHDAVYQQPFYVRFRALVIWALRFKRTVVLATVAIFVLSLVAFKLFVQQQFFPASSRVELLLDLWLPSGSSFEATEREVDKMEKLLLQDERALSVTSYVGTGSPRFYLPLDQQMPNLNFAQMMIMTRNEAERDELRLKIRELFAEQFPNVRGRVMRLENGPPVGYPVQFRLSDFDPQRLRARVSELEALVRSDPRTREVHHDWGDAFKTLRLEIDPERARALGTTQAQVSQQLQAWISGRRVGAWREHDRFIEILLRLNDGERAAIEQLGSLTIQTQTGRFVAVSQLANIRFAAEESLMWRRNRAWTMTVRSDVVDGVQAADVSIALWPKVQAWAKEAGLRVELGGSLESSQNSQAAIAAVQGLMILLVVTLLMVQLQSFQRTLLVLLTAPLGMIGVTLSLILFHAPFGFVAMLGVIALSGMIMRNSVILVDQIEQDQRAGIAAWEAIVGSTVRRFRPIMLTAVAAILAMIPLTRSTFWGPMAMAIMGGLFVATALTLIFLPALYAWWFRVNEPR